MRKHSFVSRRTTHEVRVAYVDTDRANVVHHSRYFRFLEVARVEFWRSGGLSYRQFEEETGMGLPVVESKMRYRQAARFDDLLTVETWVSDASRASIWYDALITRDGVLLHESSIRLACVSFTEGTLRKIPDSVLDASLEPGWDV
ncbi:MAG: thioesterase family protein [Polyangiaceae bacterium]